MAEFARMRQQQQHEAAQTVSALSFLAEPTPLPAPANKPLSAPPISKQLGPSSSSGPGPQAPTTGSVPRWEDEIIDFEEYEDVTSPPPAKKGAQP